VEILDVIFPKTCLECRREGKYLCKNCISSVPFAQPTCPYCRYPSLNGNTHPNCRRQFGIDGLVSIWKHKGIIRKAILLLKYKYATVIGGELADQLISSLRRVTLPNVQFLTPIPIHWYRQNTRGFNQSLIIGKKVADSMGWNFIPDLVIKHKETISQVLLSGEKRRKNLQGVFSLNPIYKSKIDKFDSIIVFDDVFTTGSTMFELGKVLKTAGVKKVWGLTIVK